MVYVNNYKVSPPVEKNDLSYIIIMDHHKKRVQSGNTTTLYHQTSAEAARCIIETGLMNPGTKGVAGGGIYFTITPEQTYHKAQSQGVILECDVVLGAILTVDGYWISGNLQELVALGFDSVQLQRETTMLEDIRSCKRIIRLGGTEYVVYDSSQVIRVKKYTGNVNRLSFPTPVQIASFGKVTQPPQAITQFAKPTTYKVVNGHLVLPPKRVQYRSDYENKLSPLTWKKNAEGKWIGIDLTYVPKKKINITIK